MDVTILAPNINSSHSTFMVNEKDEIEYGLAALKDVGRKFVEEVCEERKNGRFSSLMDFASRVDLRKGGIRALQSMAKAGAFDEICSRDEAVSSIKSYLEASEQKFRSKESAVMEMFAQEQDLKVTGYKLETFSESEKLKMELQSFGFYYSKHPITLLRKTLSSKIQPINKLMTTTNEKYIQAAKRGRKSIFKSLIIE